MDTPERFSLRLTPHRKLALALLSAAALVFEVNQVRLFSVAQFYHFAFMIVSMALLGYGVSGTALTVWPGLSRQPHRKALPWFALAGSASILGSFVLANQLPFDSFSMAWDPRQLAILALHAVALACPFFCSGLVTALLLQEAPQSAGQTYAFNLGGSALGCLTALGAPVLLGGEGTVLLSCGLAALAALLFWANRCSADDQNSGPASSAPRRYAILLKAGPQIRSSVLFLGLTAALLATCGVDLGLRLNGRNGLPIFELRLSPYKGLSYVLQLPDSQLIYRRWNASARVDVVRSASIRSLPGLSYRYLKGLPRQDGLLVDGDDLSPIVLPGSDQGFASYLPSALAYQLRPGASTLVLEPRGGLEVVAALANGAGQVTAVEANPLIIEAAAAVYRTPAVQVVIDSDRSFARRTAQKYAVIVLNLVSPYRPVRSGAYSLAEDYRYTLESIQDLLDCLQADGLLVLARWQQTPPSETLRAFSLLVAALEQAGLDPAQQIAVLRGYNLATFVVKKSPFQREELALIRRFAAERAFDLSYLPGIQPEEANRYNVLPEPLDYLAFQRLLDPRTRRNFIESYPFDITPPSDDRPFFDHFFTWAQAGQVLAEMGKTWAPFGGAGYFVILILLAIAILLAVVLILLPLPLVSRPLGITAKGRQPRLSIRFPLYFALLGFAFLLVEIPLIQRFILYLGHPTYAMSVVLFSLLSFSGLGSQLSQRIRLLPALVVLALLLFSLPGLLPLLTSHTLQLPLGLRLLVVILVIAPLGLLMGVPFPAGLGWLAQTLSDPVQSSPRIAWMWAINGCTSVISAVLAALLALTFGFNVVLCSGAACYALAALTYGLRPR